VNSQPSVENPPEKQAD